MTHAKNTFEMEKGPIVIDVTVNILGYDIYIHGTITKRVIRQTVLESA